jgi:hypothetical protein
LDRIREALPSQELQRVFADLVSTVEESFRLEEDCERAESELITKEGELRMCMKKEVQGLLSTKVINLRKDVDKQRH